MAARGQLVGKSTLDDLWVRHFADRCKCRRRYQARRWLDLVLVGFPGLTAIKYADEPDTVISSSLISANVPFCERSRRNGGARAHSFAAGWRRFLPASTSQSTQSARAPPAPLDALTSARGKFIERAPLVFSETIRRGIDKPV
jgi:hypothetical protein